MADTPHAEPADVLNRASGISTRGTLTDLAQFLADLGDCIMVDTYLEMNLEVIERSDEFRVRYQHGGINR